MSTLHIELSPELERWLENEAKRQGTSREDAALSAVERQAAQSPAAQHSILELEGLGAELWQDEHGLPLDATEYVRALRAEWDDRI